jgi:Zn-dependent peptidase ImmA (M78 family)
MLLNHLLESKEGEDSTLVDMLPHFLPLAMSVLEIKHLPKIRLMKRIEDKEQPTFGKFVHDKNTIYVALSDRHPNDIMRTLAHELTHYKQGTEHNLSAGSGRTGSPEENQAHEMAGIIMRRFNKAHPQFLRARPVIFGK